METFLGQDFSFLGQDFLGYCTYVHNQSAAWGMERWNENDSTHRDLLQSAKQAAATELSGRASVPDTDVRIGDDLVFLPHFFIGSIGLLYIPSSSLVISLGSYTGIDDFLWAYHNGMNLTGVCTNTLRISAVANPTETLRTLRKITSAQYVRNERLKERLAELPIDLVDIDLYFAIRQLRTAEIQAHFQFDII